MGIKSRFLALADVEQIQHAARLLATAVSAHEGGTEVARQLGIARANVYRLLQSA